MKSEKLAAVMLATCIVAGAWLALSLVPFGWSGSMVKFGPDVPSSLVLLFKSGASNNDINSFLDTVVGVPDPRGGHALLPGLQSIQAVRVGSHRGYALDFVSSATQQQKKDARARASGSPLVWRVFDNIAPSEISIPEG